MEPTTHKKRTRTLSNPNGSSRIMSGDSNYYDIISVGFGPAALAIAIAMRDCGLQARVLFLEKQSEFGWHTGMLLPSTKMQISFIKDLATLRNPRSHFTFLNYLHQKGRLVHFTNLSTHTPFREEFNDYMKWCASHFNDWVRYGQEVLSIAPAATQASAWPAEYFKVASRDSDTGQIIELSAKHVVVANGRHPAIPAGLSLQKDHNLIHSSAYMNSVPRLFPVTTATYQFAVIGAGQSAVEIAEDLLSRYPSAKVSLIMRGSALKPSDDSPFVNEIFDPSSVDTFFTLDPQTRQRCLKQNKDTNYGVVRLPLLESLYERLYRQKLLDPNQANWQMRLFTEREISGLEGQQPSTPGATTQVKLRLKHLRTGKTEVTGDAYDLVILATGYKSNSTSDVLKPLESLLDAPAPGQYSADRNYRLKFVPGKVRGDSGVWLQGWCEDTHGLSDTLLSILSIRGAELLDSILASGKLARVSARL